MNLSVFFTPLGVTPSDVAGKPVLVVDILRATTSIVTALANGARAVLPAEGADDALGLANKLDRDDLLLVGERRYEPIDGFDLGNSPTSMRGDVVGGKTLVMATSNGTPALLAADPGRPVLVGAAVNFTAVLTAARTAFQEHEELVILCAGQLRQFALEDAYTAGRFAKALLPGRLTREHRLNDGAIAARELVRHYGDRWKTAIAASAAARRLKEIGRGEDVLAASEVDRFDVAPVYAEHQIRVGQPARAGSEAG